MFFLHFINKFIYFLNKLIGKGFGSFSIAKEVKSAISFLDTSSPICFVDIGGNKGLYTDELLKFIPFSSVYIFEPSKFNLDILRAKYYHRDHIKIYPFAVSDSTYSSQLFSNEPGSGLASLNKRDLDSFGIQFDFSETVEIIRFDQFWLNNFPNRIIDLIKIDIEGLELKALFGMSKCLQLIKVIQFEFGGANIDSHTYFKDFWRFFDVNNFSLYRITPFGLLKIQAYSESDEYFVTTNFVAFNNSFQA